MVWQRFAKPPSIKACVGSTPIASVENWRVRLIGMAAVQKTAAQSRLRVRISHSPSRVRSSEGSEHRSPTPKAVGSIPTELIKNFNLWEWCNWQTRQSQKLVPVGSNPTFHISNLQLRTRSSVGLEHKFPKLSVVGSIPTGFITASFSHLGCSLDFS